MAALGPKLVRTPLLLLALGACQGNLLGLEGSDAAGGTGIVDTTGGGGSTGGGAGSTGTAGGLGGTGSMAGDGSPVDGGNVGDTNFVPAAPAVYARKVANLLAGQVATPADIAAVQQDPNALGGLVDKWMQTDGYRANLKEFFNTQFQQSGTQYSYFPSNMYDWEDESTIDEELWYAIRDSWARTVLALVDEGRPFTEVLTTRRYMMTTGLMSYYAMTDSSYLSEARGWRVNRWCTNNDNCEAPALVWQQNAGPISTKDSANPASANYLHFYKSNLRSSYGNMEDQALAAQCASTDPFVMTSYKTFAFGIEWGYYIWRWMNGFGFSMFLGDQYDQCDAVGGEKQFTLADGNDWRMVTIRRPTSGESASTFFDLETLRDSNVLLMNSPRLGFFTTPAFLSQWSTNESNSARAAVNQTLITALGGQVNGSDRLAKTSPSAVDDAHASDAACYACHETLDPLRQFFRQSYSVRYGPQDDTAQLQIPATLSFRGQVVNGKGNGVEDLAQALADHPLFAQAWTVKLCSWANSAPCAADDPEVQRIAGRFAASNFSWNQLVRDVFTSPLVTYAASTATAKSTGILASMQRRQQLCTLLSVRLGRPNLCNLSFADADGQNIVSSRAAVLPPDTYARGLNNPLYVVQPDPFYVANTQNLCALVAEDVVDGANAFVTSSNPNQAVTTLVGSLMGLDPNADATPVTLLRAHYDDARSAGYSKTDALRSTFTAACSSAMVTTVGQ